MQNIALNQTVWFTRRTKPTHGMVVPPSKVVTEVTEQRNFQTGTQPKKPYFKRASVNAMIASEEQEEDDVEAEDTAMEEGGETDGMIDPVKYANLCVETFMQRGFKPNFFGAKSNHSQKKQVATTNTQAPTIPNGNGQFVSVQ